METRLRSRMTKEAAAAAAAGVAAKRKPHGTERADATSSQDGDTENNNDEKSKPHTKKKVMASRSTQSSEKPQFDKININVNLTFASPKHEIHRSVPPIIINLGNIINCAKLSSSTLSNHKRKSKFSDGVQCSVRTSSSNKQLVSEIYNNFVPGVTGSVLKESQGVFGSTEKGYASFVEEHDIGNSSQASHHTDEHNALKRQRLELSNNYDIERGEGIENPTDAADTGEKALKNEFPRTLLVRVRRLTQNDIMMHMKKSKGGSEFSQSAERDQLDDSDVTIFEESGDEWGNRTSNLNTNTCRHAGNSKIRKRKLLRELRHVNREICKQENNGHTVSCGDDCNNSFTSFMDTSGASSLSEMVENIGSPSDPAPLEAGTAASGTGTPNENEITDAVVKSEFCLHSGVINTYFPEKSRRGDSLKVEETSVERRLSSEGKIRRETRSADGSSSWDSGPVEGEQTHMKQSPIDYESDCYWLNTGTVSVKRMEEDRSEESAPGTKELTPSAETPHDEDVLGDQPRPPESTFNGECVFSSYSNPVKIEDEMEISKEMKMEDIEGVKCENVFDDVRSSDFKLEDCSSCDATSTERIQSDDDPLGERERTMHDSYAREEGITEASGNPDTVRGRKMEHIWTFKRESPAEENDEGNFPKSQRFVSSKADGNRRKCGGNGACGHVLVGDSHVTDDSGERSDGEDETGRANPGLTSGGGSALGRREVFPECRVAPGDDDIVGTNECQSGSSERSGKHKAKSKFKHLRRIARQKVSAGTVQPKTSKCASDEFRKKEERTVLGMFSNDRIEYSTDLRDIQLKCILKEMKKRNMTDSSHEGKKKKRKPPKEEIKEEEETVEEEEEEEEEDVDSKVVELPSNVLEHIPDVKREVTGSRSEGDKDTSRSKNGKKPKKSREMSKNDGRGAKGGDDYIPLNVTGPTKFSLVPLKKFDKNPSQHPAVNWKKEMIYGSRIKRTPYSTVMTYRLKTDARRKAQQLYERKMKM